MATSPKPVPTSIEQSTRSTPAIDDALADKLRSSCRGAVIRPGDREYDPARSLWNGMIDRRPGVIVRCTGVADVVAAVGFARENDLEVAVRSGGHNVAGRAVCDDGLVIDLSTMRGVRVDPGRRTARAQAGVTWGLFDRETQAFGLATTGGAVTTTGIAGLTLGGGVGWLMGKHGATCDNLLSVDVVLADGRVVTASEDENPDLFWALRGGGGNFGVATSFEYRLHPVGPVVGGMVLHPFDAAPEVLRFYRDFTTDAPDELTIYAGFLHTPEGLPVVALIPCYCGDPEEGERVLEPLRAFGSPVVDAVQVMPYTAHQAIFDPGVPAGQQSYWRAGQLDDLTDDAIDTIVAWSRDVTSPRTVSLIEHHHGAITRVDPGATAFPHREPPYELVTISLWDDPSESDRHVEWTRAFFDAMGPFFRGGVYMNALSDDESDRIREAYGANYERLASVKATYDPTNFFHLNHNIPPA